MLSRNVSRILGFLGFILLVSAGLTGCNNVNSQEVNRVVKPVKLTRVPDLSSQHTDSFIGKLDATERAVLSFNVAGEIDSVMPRMGKQITKGELLAALDPTDYQLALDTRQAEFDLAETQFLRAKALIKDLLISKDLFDQTETNYKVAKAQLAQAKTDLTYTKIIAPFDGTVSLTNAESHQVVAANQAVMKVLNNTVMDVIFTVPVSFVSQYGVGAINRSQVWVTMDSARDQKMPAQFKEISTQPNTDTNTYTARVTVHRPANVTLLSGMSGQVHVANPEKKRQFTLPRTAWINRDGDNGHVWKFEPNEKRVMKTAVVLDNNGIIRSGLQQGDLIVETGIAGLVEGQRVKRWVEEDGI
ncbi:efflux RND transporter periplasmic adaptor subunit [Paraglaciecola sp. 20A4]|uniref:efflux RND transporter periplasmic adaptor subunit n=1 Tax=Paraglaciecola sp. 20A4 TaxID=2687288 RepID=UPI00140C9E72|nr:efflux RND transporter periplasmic adaptor subunit [Paraglaciecola sp. 20A4]